MNQKLTFHAPKDPKIGPFWWESLGLQNKCADYLPKPPCFTDFKWNFLYENQLNNSQWPFLEELGSIGSRVSKRRFIDFQLS